MKKIVLSIIAMGFMIAVSAQSKKTGKRHGGNKANVWMFSSDLQFF